MKVSEMKNDLVHSIAAVCGGGPSLPGDLQLVFERYGSTGRDVTVIAVKQHALFLQHDLGFAVQYCCFLEDPDAADQAELRTALRLSPELLKVAPFSKWSDVELDVPWWQGGFSSTLATWLAGWMGAESILLCGMDCYHGSRPYWYERPGWSHPCTRSSVADNLAAWRLAFDKVPHAERIRAVSGPLVELFGRWLP